MWSPTWKGRELKSGGTQAEASPQGHPGVTVWLKAHYEENASTRQCYLRNLKKYCENSLRSQKLLLIFSSVSSHSTQWMMGKCAQPWGVMLCTALGCDAMYSLGVWRCVQPWCVMLPSCSRKPGHSSLTVLISSLAVLVSSSIWHTRTSASSTPKKESWRTTGSQNI